MLYIILKRIIYSMIWKKKKIPNIFSHLLIERGYLHCPYMDIYEMFTSC